MDYIPIGQVAERLGLSPSALRPDLAQISAHFRVWW
ncbi:MAG: MerR family transcriptional regulator [Pseudonocardia sp.]